MSYKHQTGKKKLITLYSGNRKSNVRWHFSCEAHFRLLKSSGVLTMFYFFPQPEENLMAAVSLLIYFYISSHISFTKCIACPPKAFVKTSLHFKGTFFTFWGEGCLHLLYAISVTAYIMINCLSRIKSKISPHRIDSVIYWNFTETNTTNKSAELNGNTCSELTVR